MWSFPLKEWADKYKKDNKLLVKDAYIDGNKMYLLLTGRVFSFSLERAVPELVSIYLLPHGFYRTFAVWKNFMYCFNDRDVAIEKFTF